MDKLIRVLIVEDDDLLRSGLEQLILAEADMTTAGTAQNGRLALETIRRRKPDVVLLDLEMPVMGGLECIVEIRKLHADLPILILSSFNDEDHICQGLAYGANGYLLKGESLDRLGDTIRDLMNDQFVLTAEVGRRLARFVLSRSDHVKQHSMSRYFGQNNLFDKQEQDIIQLLLGGHSNKEIAERLFFSLGTIKNKLTIIYEKIGVGNREEAIRYLEEQALPASR